MRLLTHETCSHGPTISCLPCCCSTGVFYNHTASLECFSFKQGVNPETGVCMCLVSSEAVVLAAPHTSGAAFVPSPLLLLCAMLVRFSHSADCSLLCTVPRADEDGDFWGFQYCTEQFMPFSKSGVEDM